MNELNNPCCDRFVSINAVEQHTNIFSSLGELLRRVVAYVPISELEKYLPDVRPRPRKRRSMRRRRSPVRMPPGHWLYEEDWLVPFPDARQADGRIELLIDGNGEVGLARLWRWTFVRGRWQWCPYLLAAQPCVSIGILGYSNILIDRCLSIFKYRPD